MASLDACFVPAVASHGRLHLADQAYLAYVRVRVDETMMRVDLGPRNNVSSDQPRYLYANAIGKFLLTPGQMVVHGLLMSFLTVYTIRPIINIQ